ncbi:MAG: DUF4145 domain-containing protein [Candidatus Poribacteria bacterium]|nr:DUF4145 domain-containing protein [Candidatus Poribacteria bacterium]
MAEYYPPRYQSEQFHCPYCRVFAAQHWDAIMRARPPQIAGQVPMPLHIKKARIEVSFCSHCYNPTFWLKEKIIYPPMHTAPPVNSDLPDDVKQVYDEAASIADQSPRSACALLRLAIEMLMEHLGETGSINESIGNLVKKGLNPQVQQSLDIVRVTGNNAVHAGKIAFDDTTDVQALFGLINVIADVLITQPKKVQALYDGLPESSKKAVEKRDGKAQ